MPFADRPTAPMNWFTDRSAEALARGTVLTIMLPGEAGNAGAGSCLCVAGGLPQTMRRLLGMGAISSPPAHCPDGDCFSKPACASLGQSGPLRSVLGAAPVTECMLGEWNKGYTS
jgi:hypothetical protein